MSPDVVLVVAIAAIIWAYFKKKETQSNKHD